MNTTYAFWAVAAVLVAFALAFLLPPLLRNRQLAFQAGRRSINIAVYRDQLKEMEVDHRNGLLTDDQFAAAKVELEARLAQDAIEAAEDAAPVSRSGRILGIVLAALVPVLAFAMYLKLGNPDAMNPQAMARGQGSHDLAAMVVKLEEKLKEEPGNGEGWMMLGQSYAVLGRWDDAAKAYAESVRLQPGQAAPLSHLAEVEAIRAGRVLAGKPMELVAKAIKLDANDKKALELSGIYAFQEKNYKAAAGFFKRLYQQLPPDSSYAQDIAGAIQEAERLANPASANASASAGPDSAQADGKAAAPGATIAGVLDIAPALKAKAAPGDVVFLFARPSAGGPPVAAIRAAVGNLPLKFELSDAMAMNPDSRLSNFKAVELVARVAKSGDVKGAAGDLEGGPATVKVGATGVKLVIDRVRN